MAGWLGRRFLVLIIKVIESTRCFKSKGAVHTVAGIWMYVMLFVAFAHCTFGFGGMPLIVEEAVMVFL